MTQIFKEEFDRMARALSMIDLSDEKMIAIWFCCLFSCRRDIEDTEEFRNKILSRAKDLKDKRKRVKGEVESLLSCISAYFRERGIPAHCHQVELYPTKIVVWVDEDRYIITIESESGLEKDNEK